QSLRYLHSFVRTSSTSFPIRLRDADCPPHSFPTRRSSDLPMSAVIIRDGLYNRAKKMTDFSLLHLISRTPDLAPRPRPRGSEMEDRKSTRLNSSHEWISYAVFCLKKKKTGDTARIALLIA